MTHRPLYFLIVLLLIHTATYAQEPLTEHTLSRSDTLARPPATLSDVAWLVGSWHGPGLGGETDEIWLPPVGGAMPGMFRFVQEGKPIFYEIWAMREVEGTLLLELKHFDPDITSWEEREEKTRFHFIRAEEDTVYFGGLTYYRADDDTLQIWLAIRDRDGNIREEAFTLHRRPVKP
ncbi:MAG TPA: DUF6265 family protein [Rhodothermales bacterium]|nr:DUF6265 family protein [Rhodothermales bacterium]